VPVRDVERNLPRLLPSLLSQGYPNYEVVVVDDQSTDATPRILAEWSAKEGRLKVVRGVELPRGEGWHGKPHAMYQGAKVARGEWLLFTDADTVHSELSVSSSMAYALRRRVDLLSIGPYPELVTPAERLLMPVAFMGVSTFFPAAKVNDPNSAVAIANGQYIFIRREVYDAVGGIERVKDKIAEDLEFGKVVKSAGYRLYIADGRHLMTVRMYTNLRELWEGWGKNTVLSFRENPIVGVLGVPAIVLSPTLPVAWLKWAVNSWRTANRTQKPADELAAAWVTALSVMNTLVPFIYRRRVDRQLGLGLGWTLTQPVGTLIFGLILLNSFLRLITGRGVTWKGRTYANRK
jgi:chlorobactene glucosyltransferase